MRLEQSFEVPVPVAQAWSVLLDVERIAPCMPGAALTDFDGERFTGIVKVKLGPVSLAYRGSGRFAERDEAERRVVIIASGQDSRGAGGASARVTAVLHDNNGGATTQVTMVTELDIAGRAAQFGRGMIGDVSNKLVKQFADCVAATISAEPVPISTVEPSPAAGAGPPRVELEPIPAPEPTVISEAPGPSYAVSAPEPTAAGIAFPEAEAAPTPEAEAAPTPADVAPDAAAATEAVPTPAPRPAPREVEPIDLLAVTGAKGMMRRAAPYLILLLLVIVALVVWLAVR